MQIYLVVVVVFLPPHKTGYFNDAGANYKTTINETEHRYEEVVIWERRKGERREREAEREGSD